MCFYTVELSTQDFIYYIIYKTVQFCSIRFNFSSIKHKFFLINELQFVFCSYTLYFFYWNNFLLRERESLAFPFPRTTSHLNADWLKVFATLHPPPAPIRFHGYHKCPTTTVFSHFELMRAPVSQLACIVYYKLFSLFKKRTFLKTFC